MIGVDHRHQRDRTPVDHDFALGLRAVGQHHRLQGQIDFPAPVDHPALGHVSRHLILGPAAQTRANGGAPHLERIVRTGQDASRTIRSATEPSKTWLSPVRPCVAITIKSIAASRA